MDVSGGLYRKLRQVFRMRRHVATHQQRAVQCQYDAICPCLIVLLAKPDDHVGIHEKRQIRGAPLHARSIGRDASRSMDVSGGLYRKLRQVFRMRRLGVKSLGDEARQAKWAPKGHSRCRAQARGHSAPHVGRPNRVQLVEEGGCRLTSNNGIKGFPQRREKMSLPGRWRW
jgi:hypothetical protein